MFKVIRVKLNERVVLFKNGLPVRALGAGRFVLWGRHWTEQRWNTNELVFRALPESRAAIPREWYDEVTIGALERGVLYRDGVPAVFLRPGVHRYWTSDPSVALSVFDVRQPLPALTQELEALIPRGEYVDVTVEQHEKGLRFEQGRLVAVLEPGRYKLWTHPEARAQIVSVDVRRTEVTIPGQELMTRDKVSLRLTLTVETPSRTRCSRRRRSRARAIRCTSRRSSLHASTSLESRSTSCSKVATPSRASSSRT